MARSLERQWEEKFHAAFGHPLLLVLGRLLLAGLSSIYSLLADGFDLLLQTMDLLTHAKNMPDACGIDALIGQCGNLFKRCDILIGVEAIFALLPSWFPKSRFLVATKHLRMYPEQFALGLLLLRLTFGLIFFAHGVQKLFGLFGAQGLQGTTRMMEMLGLRPTKW